MMKNFARIIVGSVLFASHSVFAAPITIDFTVTATSARNGNDNFNGTSYAGYSVGSVGSGYFTFDDSLTSFPLASKILSLRRHTPPAAASRER